MQAMILTAGFGTRMKPFTESFPKPLVPVNDVPLILYTLAFLKKNGFREVFLNLHHQGDKIVKLLGNGAAIGMRIRYSRESMILGTGGGIRKIMPRVRDDLLIVNGDVVADFDLKALLRQHRRSKDVMTMALCHPENPDRFGHGRIYYEGAKMTSMIGHPPPGPKAKGAIYASYHVLSKPGIMPRLKTLPANEAFCVIRRVYVPDIVVGKPFGAHVIDGFWTICDSLADVAATESALKASRHPLSYARELLKSAKILGSKRIFSDLLECRRRAL